MADQQVPQREIEWDGLFSQPAGEELTPDAPGSDRIDRALEGRFNSYESASDVDWLLNASVDETDMPTQPTDPSDSVARTVAKNISEIPRGIASGVQRAAQETLDFGSVLEDWVPIGSTMGGLQIFDTEGNFSPALIGPDEFKRRHDAGERMDLPLDVDRPETMTGGIVEGLAQFLAPFAAIGKMQGGLKGGSMIGTLVRNMHAGAWADLTAFDEHEARLSNLVQSFPALQNPVTEFLAADEDDSAIEGRLKNALEGLGAGAAFDAFTAGLRGYRALRKTFGTADDAARAVEQMRTVQPDDVLRDAVDLNLLGDASGDAPLMKIGKAIKETETGVPDDVAARGLTGAAKAGKIGGDEVFINFARIDTSEDIQSVIGNMADAMKPSVNKARRGKRANKVTELAADKVDAWQTLMNRRTGEPLNAEQSVAARQLWAAATDKLTSLAETAASNPSPENLFQFRRMMAVQHAVQKEVIAARTETARALQSWRIPTGGNMERMAEITEALGRSGGDGVSREMAIRLAVLAKTPNAAQAINQFAEKTLRAKTLGAVQEYWINALLSGPKTHMVNMMSNTAVAALSVPERAIASVLGPALRGTDEAGVEIGEAFAQVAGLRGGIIDGFRNAGKAMRTGQTGFGVDKIEMPRQRMISSGTWNVRSDSWVGQGIDALGAAVNVPGKLLQAADEFFKTIGYRMELHAQTTRMATKEMRDGALQRGDLNKRIAEILDNPPESIRLESVANAAYQTFTNAPGPLTMVIQNAMHKFPILRFILPFTNTPANILKYTFDRTPLAPVTSRYRNAIAKGGAAADLARTRMVLGTMGLLYTLELAMDGHTTGNGPENTTERQNWARQGRQPYSLKVGDKWIKYNRLDPLGYHLGISADIAEFLLNESQPTEDTGAESQEAFSAAVFAIAENITSKSYLQGLSGIIEAINDPDVHGARYIERFASSFIPTGVREIKSAMDPTMRVPHDIVSAMKNKIPVLSEDLPARRDLWGKEIVYQSGLGATYDVISPLYGRTYDPEPIDLAMEKDGWFIGMGGYKFTVDGEHVSLKNRPDIKNRFYELRGGTKPSAMGEYGDVLIDSYGDLTLLEVLNGMVTGEHHLNDQWQEAETPEDREDLAKSIVRDYYLSAKDKLFEEYPWIEETAERKRALRTAE